MMKSRSLRTTVSTPAAALLVACLGMALVCLSSLSGSALAGHREPPRAPKELLAELRKLARTDAAAASEQLRALDTAAWDSNDIDTWFDLARSAALRTGDHQWLQSMRTHRSEFSDVYVYRVLLAGGLVEEGKLDEARAELDKIDDLERVNVRDRRRVHALEARMALLEGNTRQERESVERIVGELQYWGSNRCQSCHDDSKFPGQAPLLDVRTPWYATRFIALMKHDGDASAVRDRSLAVLADDPNNTNARLRLAYASLALGDDRDADEQFARVPWVKNAERSGGTARMMTPYP